MTPFLRAITVPVRIRLLALEESGTQTDVVVRVRPPIIQVQRSQTSVSTITPVPAA